MAAHVLASHSDGPSSCVWQEEPPDYLISVMADNVSLLTDE